MDNILSIATLTDSKHVITLDLLSVVAFSVNTSDVVRYEDSAA